jgi:hypothetical protein
MSFLQDSVCLTCPGLRQSSSLHLCWVPSPPSQGAQSLMLSSLLKPSGTQPGGFHTTSCRCHTLTLPTQTCSEGQHYLVLP